MFGRSKRAPATMTVVDYHKAISARLPHVRHTLRGRKYAKRAEEGRVVVYYLQSANYDCESLDSIHHHPMYETRSYWRLGDTGYVYATGVGIGQIAQDGDLTVINPVRLQALENIDTLHSLYDALLEFVI